MRCVSIHLSSGVVTVVEFIRAAIGIPGLGKDKDILSATERIWVHGNRADVDIGVVTRRLTGRGAVEVPFRELVNTLGCLL